MKGFRYIAILFAIAAMLWAKTKMEAHNKAEVHALESIDDVPQNHPPVVAPAKTVPEK